MMKANVILVPLNRPEYVPVPEAMISALAWKIFKNPESVSGRVPHGMVYDGRELDTGSVHVRRTIPQGDQLALFGSALVDAGLSSSASTEMVAEAVANSIRGIRSERGQVQASSPMTPALARMQDLRGIQGKSSPADLGGIIETIYSLGRRPEETASESSAARLWLNAARHRMTRDALLSTIDAALEAAVLGGPPEYQEERPVRGEDDERVGLYSGTAFSWFRETWERLTSEAWVEALPARVWVDWATTVLRLGVGMGYLWEASWYDAVAREVLSRRATTWSDLVQLVPEPLPWKPLSERVSIRDVAGHAKRRLETGDRLRTVFSRWLVDNDAQSDELFDTLDAMSDDPSLRKNISNAFSSDENKGKIWESTQYALATRESSGQYTDYYGVLRRVGRRYLVVEPGTEWIAVVASLACVSPGGSCDVGRVLKSLTHLGMRPEITDLVSLLERAGMARGSADADNAVIVQSAF